MIQIFRKTIRLTNQKLDIKIIGINKALVYPEPSFQNEDSVLTPPEEIDEDEALRLMNHEEEIDRELEETHKTQDRIERNKFIE